VTFTDEHASKLQTEKKETGTSDQFAEEDMPLQEAKGKKTVKGISTKDQCSIWGHLGTKVGLKNFTRGVHSSIKNKDEVGLVLRQITFPIRGIYQHLNECAFRCGEGQRSARGGTSEVLEMRTRLVPAWKRRGRNIGGLQFPPRDPLSQVTGGGPNQCSTKHGKHQTRSGKYRGIWKPRGGASQ